ncbi:MAG: DUF4253 domain-containing protein [Oscillibacter sp.]|nr:DUF4253 domain-containing protein [Oscillibacter sp.]
MQTQGKMSELLSALAQYLDCPCTYFPPMKNDAPIMAAYRAAQTRGKQEGFTPMLIPEDDILWEMLLFNACGDGDRNIFTFDLEKVRQYRKETLDFPLRAGHEIFKELERSRMEDLMDDDYLEEIMGEDTVNAKPSHSFAGYTDCFSKKTLPLLLAEIPAKHPWEVFAWLPIGGWNECPAPEDMIAAAKYWFEEYGAVPAVATHDVLEFNLSAPVGAERAEALAKEQYFWCPDIVDQGIGSIKALANQLKNSTVWFFWWD